MTHEEALRLVDRAAEEAAIAAHIAARGVIRLPSVDPTDATIDRMLAGRRGKTNGMREAIDRHGKRRKQQGRTR